MLTEFEMSIGYKYASDKGILREMYFHILIYQICVEHTKNEKSKQHNLKEYFTNRKLSKLLIITGG